MLAIGDWGRLTVSPEANAFAALVHPDDRDQYATDRPMNCLAECIALQDDYIVIQFNQTRYRVKPDALSPVPRPEKGYNDSVIVVTDSKPTKCQIRQIVWHFKNEEPYYLLVTERGKILSRRYSLHDFVPSGIGY